MGHGCNVTSSMSSCRGRVVFKHLRHMASVKALIDSLQRAPPTFIIRTYVNHMSFMVSSAATCFGFECWKPAFSQHDAAHVKP